MIWQKSMSQNLSSYNPFSCKNCRYEDKIKKLCNMGCRLEYSRGEGCKAFVEDETPLFYDFKFYEERLERFVRTGLYENPDKDDLLCNYLERLFDSPLLKVRVLSDEITASVFLGVIKRFLFNILDQNRLSYQLAQSEADRIGKTLSWSNVKMQNGWQALVKDLTDKYGEFGFEGAFYKKEFGDGGKATDKNLWEKMCIDWHKALKRKLDRGMEEKLNEDSAKLPASLEESEKRVRRYMEDHPVSPEEFRQVWPQLGGYWNEYDFAKWLKIAKLQREYPDLVEIACRMGHIADDMGADRIALRQGSTEKLEHASKSDILGVTSGNDLGALLPGEMAMYLDSETEDLFYQKYLSSQLQIFRYRSEIMTPTRSLNKRAARQRGPMIVCCDTSGSMFGKPADIAKSMLLKVLEIACSQKRNCYLICFSVHINAIDATQNPVEAMKLLSDAFTGDTDATRMLDRTFELLESSPEFMYADVLWISDFAIPYPSEKKLQKMLDYRNDGTCFYGLQIGTLRHEWHRHFDEIRSIGYVPDRRFRS